MKDLLVGNLPFKVSEETRRSNGRYVYGLKELWRQTAMNPNDEPVMKQTKTVPYEDIALRAYRLWEERGSPIGSPKEDWFRAEQEIRSENTRSADKAQVKRNPARTGS